MTYKTIYISSSICCHSHLLPNYISSPINNTGVRPAFAYINIMSDIDLKLGKAIDTYIGICRKLPLRHINLDTTDKLISKSQT